MIEILRWDNVGEITVERIGENMVPIWRQKKALHMQEQVTTIKWGFSTTITIAVPVFQHELLSGPDRHPFFLQTTMHVAG